MFLFVLFLFLFLFFSPPGRRKEGRRKEGNKEQSRKEGRKSDLRSYNSYLEVDLQLGKDYKSLYHNPHIIVPASVGFRI